MYGRAGLLIRRGVKGGGFFVTVGKCLLAGRLGSDKLACRPSGLGNETPRGPVGHQLNAGAYLHNPVRCGLVLW